MGDAEVWWNSPSVWNGLDKTDYKTVVSEWKKRWPEKGRRTKGTKEKMEEFAELEIRDEDVRKKVQVDGEEVYAQVEFVQQLMKKARACGDVNLMVSQGIDKLPPRLQAALGPLHIDLETWEELGNVVMKLLSVQIKLADDELVTKAKIEALFTSATQQTAAPSAPIPVYWPTYALPRYQSANCAS